MTERQVPISPKEAGGQKRTLIREVTEARFIVAPLTETDVPHWQEAIRTRVSQDFQLLARVGLSAMHAALYAFTTDNPDFSFTQRSGLPLFSTEDPLRVNPNIHKEIANFAFGEAPDAQQRILLAEGYTLLGLAVAADAFHQSAEEISQEPVTRVVKNQILNTGFARKELNIATPTLLKMRYSPRNELAIAAELNNNNNSAVYATITYGASDFKEYASFATGFTDQGFTYVNPGISTSLLQLLGFTSVMREIVENQSAIR